jgi:hypothetical protein
MVTNVDRSTIDAFVARPGIALINWYSRHHPLSRLFDADYQRASMRLPEVNFADVDVADDPVFAALWGVPRAPELMGFRDGTLVFNHAVALPERIVEALIGAIASLEMDRVREGIDGGNRLYLWTRPKGGARFDLGRSGGAGRIPPSGGRFVKH